MLDHVAAPAEAARLIYPFYCKLIEHLDLEMFRCRDLDSNAPLTPDAMERVRLWLQEADRRIDVSNLRHFLQGTFVPDEATLRALILHHLHKGEKTDSDRYKVDFLLGNYLAQKIAPQTHGSALSYSRVGELLAPILGHTRYLSYLEEIDKSLQQLELCHNLQDLMERRVLDRGRALKDAAGLEYYEPAALIAFTRFNFLTRSCFIRLLHNEVDEIEHTLTALQVRGVHSVDCRPAGLGAAEGIDGLRRRMGNWKKPFSGKYSDTDWLRQVSQLRILLRGALDHTLKVAVDTEAAQSECPTQQPAMPIEPDSATSDLDEVECQTITLEPPETSSPEKSETVQRPSVFVRFRATVQRIIQICTLPARRLRSPAGNNQFSYENRSPDTEQEIATPTATAGSGNDSHSDSNEHPAVNAVVREVMPAATMPATSTRRTRTYSKPSRPRSYLKSFPRKKIQAGVVVVFTIALMAVMGWKLRDSVSMTQISKIKNSLQAMLRATDHPVPAERTLPQQGNTGQDLNTKERRRKQLKTSGSSLPPRRHQPRLEEQEAMRIGRTRIPNVFISPSARGLKKQPLPVYPAAAAQRHITGTVELELMIGADGKVKMIKPLAGNPLLVDSVIRAAKSWEYERAPRQSAQQVQVKFIYSSD